MKMPEVEIYFIIFGCIILFVCFALFGLFLFKKNIRNIKENILENQQLKSQFQQALLQTQLEIQEQTLKTISQEIHDNVGQVLSLAKLNLGTFEDTESIYNQTKINDTKQLVSKAINDLRDLSRSLHGDKITELGLQESVSNELKILQNTGQYKTELKIIGDGYKLEPQKEMVLFRIVQEAINNAIKHSKAKNINVQLKYDPAMFILMINDDGVGFNATALDSAQTGIGLKNMQNRASLIGGLFSINSLENSGTSVSVEIPTLNVKP